MPHNRKKIFLIVLLLCVVFLVCAFIFIYFQKLKIEEHVSLKTDIQYQKYQYLEDQNSNLPSRQWMNVALIIAKQEDFAPAAASRFYAYTASLYADVLDKTKDSAQANQATRDLIMDLMPKYKNQIDDFISSQKIAFHPLSEEATSILFAYVERSKTDGFSLVWDQKIKDPKTMWFIRFGEVDGAAMAGKWQSWILSPDEDFQVPPPPTRNSLADRVELEKVKYAVSKRQAKDLLRSYFWHGSFGFIKGQNRDNITLAGVWQNILFAEEGQNSDDASYAKAQKLLAQAIADAFIYCWRVKYTYFTQKPSMRIPNLDLAIADRPFPSYVSEHSTISQTAAVVLSSLFPNKEDIWYKNAQDARNSRLLAGIHFDIDNQAGKYLGQKIGEKIMQKVREQKYEKESKLSLLADLVSLKLLHLLFLAQSQASQIAKKTIDVVYLLKKEQKFEDITSKSGVAFNNSWAKANQNMYGTDKIDNLAGGVVAADFTNDGLADLYFVSGDTGHLFINKGSLRFEEKPLEEAGIVSYKNGTGVIAADYDNDGNEDLLLYGYETSPRLYRNLGNAEFKDVTKEVGLERNDFFAFGAAFGDYDKDGWLDLYVANYMDLPKLVFKNRDNLDHKSHSNVLFKNDHGVFTDVTKETGLTNKYPSLAVTFLDYNNDGWSDLLVANDFSPNQLYKNNKNDTFTDVSNLLDYKYKNDNNAMGIATADFNNDGFIDAYLSNIYKDMKQGNEGGNLLLTNISGNKLPDIAKTSHTDNGGFGWGVVPIDYNNDGLIDIAEVSGFSSIEDDSRIIALFFSASKSGVESKAFLFENKGNNNFEEKAYRLGFLSQREGRGLVVADLDNDGYPDLIINELRRFPKIYHNMGGKNNWLTIKLVGTKSNKDAIGTKVWVDNGKNTYYRELETSGTYLSSSDLRLFFGLGNAQKVREIKILWPSGINQIVHDVSVNQILTITEK